MRIGVLASGGGTNLQSIIDACSGGRISGEVALVISNNSSAGALERARRAGIPTLHVSSVTHPDPECLDKAIVEALVRSGVGLVALAGYMKKIGRETLERYRCRILNIHPALLPHFGGQGMYGMAVHRAVVASGASVSGPTVHLVSGEYDTGPILAQEEVPVLENDTPESLQERVLEAEHRIYPATIEACIQKVIAVYDEYTVVRPLCVSGEFDEAARLLDTGAERLRHIENGGGYVFGLFCGGKMTGCAAVEPSREASGVWHLSRTAVPRDASLLRDHARRVVERQGGRMIDSSSSDNSGGSVL